MSAHHLDDNASMRKHMVELIVDVENSQSVDELTEHSVYASAFLSDLPDRNVCTDEQAAEWKFQLQLAKDQATERLENLV